MWHINCNIAHTNDLVHINGDGQEGLADGIPGGELTKLEYIHIHTLEFSIQHT